MSTAPFSTIRVTKPLAAAIQQRAAKRNARVQEVALDALERGLSIDEFRAHIRAIVADEVAPLRALLDALLRAIEQSFPSDKPAQRAPVKVPEFVKQWDELKRKQTKGEEQP